MRRFRMSGLILVCLFASFAVYAQSEHLTAADAKNHVGEKATVCGSVASTHYAAHSKGSPTFFNLDEPYPKQIFTIVIWGSDRDKFGDPEAKYQNKQVCVTGKIISYRGAPEIAASEPGQIEIRK
jgi:hypothetical protein